MATIYLHKFVSKYKIMNYNLLLCSQFLSKMVQIGTTRFPICCVYCRNGQNSSGLRIDRFLIWHRDLFIPALSDGEDLLYSLDGLDRLTSFEWHKARHYSSCSCIIVPISPQTSWRPWCLRASGNGTVQNSSNLDHQCDVMSCLSDIRFFDWLSAYVCNVRVMGWCWLLNLR